jgi:hypothetical protein
MKSKRTGTIGLLATSALCGALIVGCGSSHTVSNSDFAPGTCRQMAPATLQIGHLVDTAHKKHGVPTKTEQAFATAQAQLRHLSSQTPQSQALIAAVGFLRLRVDSHTYQSSLLRDVSDAQRALVRVCTSGASASSSR